VKQKVILDTGPLVAFLNRRDTYHDWAMRQLADIRHPLLTCEAVLSEACFLMRRHAGGIQAVIDLLHSGFMTVPYHVSDDIFSVRYLIMKYADVPMSLADACLVRMAEHYRNSPVLTLDSDFQIYRRQNAEPVRIIIP
jgi:predicted nucleic acid-binding protein